MRESPAKAMSSPGGSRELPLSVLRATTPIKGPKPPHEPKFFRDEDPAPPIDRQKVYEDSGVVDIGKTLRGDSQEEEEFDMSGFGDEEEGPVVELEPEAEELSDAYLDWRMAEFPEGKDPKTVPYPEDLHEAMVKKLNKDPQLSREVDMAFAKARRRPGPPIVPPPPGATRELPPQKSMEEMQRARAKKRKDFMDEHEEITAVHDVADLQEKLRALKQMKANEERVKQTLDSLKAGNRVTDLRQYNPDGTKKTEPTEEVVESFDRKAVLAAAEAGRTTPKNERIQSFRRDEVMAAAYREKTTKSPATVQEKAQENKNRLVTFLSGLFDRWTKKDHEAERRRTGFDHSQK